MIAMVLATNGGQLVPAVKAQAPPSAVGFVLDRGDIRFIFRQIQIAEAHAAGGQLLGTGPNQVPELRVPLGLRTVDGSFNHLEPGKTGFGASDRLFPRLARPVFRPAEQGTTYQQTNGTVFDSQPRIISNLIVDQTAANPAAVEAAGFGAVPGPSGAFFIPNVAPDVGLSAPFNSMFTFFGQFFDHGLDLVNKGGNGTVVVPLQSDDPLFVQGSPTNFMILTRATMQPGPDQVLGTADDIHEANNQTTPFVDQNQTYTSHSSHQVFLREYEMRIDPVDSRLKPYSTGRMIDGGGAINGVPVKNIGNWGEVKAQAAALLGIGLVDSDVFNVPLIAADPYGRFLRGPNGFPMMIMQNGTAVEGNPAGPIPTAGARRINHGFLDDIAHNAVPAPGLAPDGDQAPNPIDVPRPTGTYDDELLAAHFVTGDGRGNENIALTAVHTVFHAEHNRLRDYIDGLIHSTGFLLASEVTAWEAQAAQPPAGSGWGYGERLFQAARFVTEMQYQHLVFEEFARKLVPSINPFIGDGINFINDTNPAITAEFAHQAYRLGHSMLTETIARTNQNGSINDISLIQGFLNPLEFNDGGPAGPLTAAQAAGAIFQGGTREVANEIDEFVTEAVRNNLLGLPLDLPVLNLARGRSEGVPPLNEIRRQLYFGTNPQPQFQPPPIGDPAIAPYANWLDFEFALKHRESLINFIAAYGIDPRGAGQPLNIASNMAQKRQAAQLLIDDADFMFADGAQTGVERIDLWIGGLAEKIAPFGSLLGTTFNYIFEVQLENLQNADRFYYLERLDGLNLLTQMEGNSFFELIARNTTLRGASADVFARPDLVLNLDALLGPGTPTTITDDPSTEGINEAAMPDLRLIGGTLRYSGPLHAVWNGRGVADRVFSSEGDDTLRGDDGPDVMEGGAGNDNFIGGDGDDILTDTFGEDVIKGGRGNDAIHGGSGPFDLLQGNEGNDFIVGGNDLSEVFGGPGNDVIYMGAGLSESIGGEGDDWMEGTESPASILIGDNNNQFQDDPDGGHDVLIARGGDADFDSEGGDDIMVGTVLPTHRLEGMLGFDWGTYRGEVRAVDADMLITGAIAVNAPLNELRDRYDLTEGLSGTDFNDLLRGDNRVEADLRDDGLTGVTNGHVLTSAGIARIAGLVPALLPTGTTEFAGGNIILGGLGSDLLEGRGGDDILDGDRWLNVQLRAPNVATTDTTDFVSVNSLDALKTDVFAGRINPGQITIVRSIVTPTTLPAADCGVASPLNCDIAVFSGPIGNYSITVNADGSLRVQDNVGTDGVDTIRGVERLQFTSGVVVAVPPTVPAVVNLTQAAALSAITAAGFSATVTTANSATVAAGLVISQSPSAGSVATPGSNVALVVSLGAAPPPAPTGLVLALGFNEASGTTVNDSSPSPKNGTIRGAVRAASRPGSGTALRFDGVDDWVTITDTTASKLDLTNGMTLEAWVNPTAMSGWETILMKERGITGEGLLSYALYAHDGAPQAGGFARPSGYVRVNPVASTTDTAVRGTAALTLNTWTHIATTYDGANLRFYVNGVLRGTVARTGNIASNNGAVRIGGNNSSLQEFFRGLIDDVRIYNRALTAAQITADMNAPIQ